MGTNWLARMDEGIQRSAQIVTVLSPAYLLSVYSQAEWRPVWKNDPAGVGDVPDDRSPTDHVSGSSSASTCGTCFKGTRPR
jgi:hypothetical protein